MAVEDDGASMMMTMMMRRRSVDVDDDHGVEHSEAGVGTAENLSPASPPSPPRGTPAREVLTPERAIELVGMGSFQRWLTALCMLGNAADAVEVLSIALVLPTAGREFGLSDADKGLLTSCIFAGGFVGALGWGLVSDRFGRRAALALAMFINALFALLSAAATDFTTLVLCRTLAGIGVSGSNTVVFTTLPEFLPAAHRGVYMVLLASGWMWGSIYSASVGWAVIPVDVADGGGWRSFVVASAMPSLLCLVGVVGFMPESPRFLAVRGRPREAVSVLRRVAARNGTSRVLPPDVVIEVPRGGDEDWNGDGDGAIISPGTSLRGRGRGVPTPPPPTTTIATQMTVRGVGGGTRLQGRRQLWRRLPRWARRGTRLFQPPLLARTLGLAFVWFSLSFGWYGLMLWLPEYFTRLTPSHRQEDNGGDSAEIGISGGTSGSSERHVYAENLLVAWANLPGNVVSAFMVDWIGRRKTLASCMAAAALAAGLFAVAPAVRGGGGGDDSAVSLRRLYIACACIFNALSVGGWNSLDLYCTEAFPTSVRSTAMGTLSACGRLGSLIGSATNGFLIGRSLMAPLGLASAMMLAGSLVTVGIPLETKGRALEDSMGECCGDGYHQRQVGDDEEKELELVDEGGGDGGEGIDSGHESLLRGGSGVRSHEVTLEEEP